MFNYDAISKMVVLTVFFLIILYDVWWIGYGIVSLVKWLYKKLRKKKESLPEAETR